MIKFNVLHFLETLRTLENLLTMKILLILLSISFALPAEWVWDDSSSEESSDSKEDISLEVDLQNLIGQNVGEKENNPNFALNKCLTIKNSEKISFCVVQLCAKNCQAIHHQSGGVNLQKV